VLPDRALYLPTFSHLLIVNELLSRSLYRSTGFTLRSALNVKKTPRVKHQGSNTKGSKLCPSPAGLFYGTMAQTPVGQTQGDVDIVNLKTRCGNFFSTGFWEGRRKGRGSKSACTLSHAMRRSTPDFWSCSGPLRGPLLWPP
jgi:hypothetical protein